MPAYVALMSKDEGSDYGVYFPDFPGCVTAGDTPEDAYRMAHEAVQLHIDSMAADNDPIPEPSSIKAVMADPENADTVAFLVNAFVPRGKAARVNVTFDQGLLEEIDAYARSHGMTRAGFLAEAAKAALKT